MEQELTEPCKHGHYYCSSYDGGPCVNESPIDPCECPNCDDPTDGGECMRNFCSVCRDELGHDATWPEQCDECSPTCYVCGEGNAIRAANGSGLPGAAHWECVNGGR